MFLEIRAIKIGEIEHVRMTRPYTKRYRSVGYDGKEGGKRNVIYSFVKCAMIFDDHLKIELS